MRESQMREREIFSARRAGPGAAPATRPAAGRRPRAAEASMMTPEQRYMLETFGFLHLKGALSSEELAAAQAAAGRYIDAAQHAPETLPEGFGQDPNDNRRFPWGFAFDKALESLVTHPAIMPIVMELTGGRPQFAMGTLQADGPPPFFHDEGLSLHRAGDENKPGTGPQLGLGPDGRMFCNDFVFFTYLDDVCPGDGGLVCLPGSHKAQLPRPPHLFGQYSWAHHIGKSHPDLARNTVGTVDRSNHPNGLRLPTNEAGLSDLPTGMVSLPAKAGDILMIPGDPVALPHIYYLSWMPLPYLWGVQVESTEQCLGGHAEALVHGSLPWLPRDRLRRVMVLRYRPHTTAGPNPQPPPVLRRLSRETREMTDSADTRCENPY